MRGAVLAVAWFVATGSALVVKPTPRLIRMCAVDSVDEQPATAAPHGVFLMNDDFNMREYVSRVLMMVAYVSEDDASSIMMQANWGGRALVGTWEKEVAEHIHEGLSQAGLRAGIMALEERPESVED